MILEPTIKTGSLSLEPLIVSRPYSLIQVENINGLAAECVQRELKSLREEQLPGFAIVSNRTVSFLLRFSRLLRVATDNLHLVRSEFLAAITLESHLLDQECPDVIAKSVGLEMTLSPMVSYTFRSNPSLQFI